MLGVYSLIRHTPDARRSDAVTVGVLVAYGSDLVTRFVERDEVPASGVVSRFKGLVEHLQEEGSFKGEAFLWELAARRFSQFQVTEPLTLEVSEALSETADQLAHLVATDSLLAH